MAFGLLSDRAQGWSQWVDATAASGWMAEAHRLGLALASVDGKGFEVQRTHVRNLFVALSNAYRAMDLPPSSDPGFRVCVKKWFGSMRPIDPASRRRNLADGAFGASFAGGYGRAEGLVHTRIGELWARWGKAPIDAEHVLCDVIVRACLDEKGLTVYSCDGVRGGSEGLCNFAGFFMGYGQDDAAREGVTAYDWRTFAWNDPPMVINGAAEFGCRIAKALPPLRWFAEFAADIAALLAVRGPLETIRQAAAYRVAANARMADRLGVLPDTLRAQAAMLPADIEAAHWENPGAKQAAAAIAVAALAAQAIPIIGQAAGAVLGILAAIEGIIPGPVGVDVDELGRGIPVFERAWLRGSSASAAPPNDIPQPPAEARTVSFLPVLLPGMPAGTGTGSREILNTPPVLTIVGGAGGAGAGRPGGAASDGSGKLAAAAAGLGLLWWFSGGR